ncbi:MarR family EPS-associated transcriptional regulator [uncultured Thiodictyon sp.]|uniref:MarR family EPS-associated transcriptional regulator n=1 Tax=uncultured Thiodictyon sp. TaxID=1846217 RepID=UPI0025FE4BB3|nr:MarR family EPS-associated transcriptional regulator [uncultured Thiodictyon sp.]
MPETRSTGLVPLSDDAHYHLLKLLAERPQASQRELSLALGVSLGKVNYCLKALLAQGWIKTSNFQNSNHKRAYLYLLTPSGIDAKARIAARFLKRKIDEFEALELEISRLKAEVAATHPDPAQRPARAPDR